MKSKNLKGKRRKKQLSRWSAPKNPDNGFLRPETGRQKKDMLIAEKNENLGGEKEHD